MTTNDKLLARAEKIYGATTGLDVGNDHYLFAKIVVALYQVSAKDTADRLTSGSVSVQNTGIAGTINYYRNCSACLSSLAMNLEDRMSKHERKS